MKKLLTLLCMFLLIGTISRAQESPALKVKVYKLANGLTVMLNEDHTQAEVFGAVGVKAGSKYDPADATGLAHYLEHMCFKGTQDMGTTNYLAEKPLLDSITVLYDQLAQTTDEKQRDAIQKHINEVSLRAAQYTVPNDMDHLIKSMGGKNLNAFTSFEQIVYHNSFPGHQVEKWLDIYSERFINPVFRLFQPELEVVYEEKNMGSDNAFARLFEEYLKSIFKNHPYGTQTTIGKTEHLKNPPLRRMMAYYNTYFVANNMVLVLSGDFKIDEVMPIIEKKFGRWRSGEVPKFPEYKEAPFKGRELVSKKLTPIKLGILGFRTVKNTDEDRHGLAVCSGILSNRSETGLLDELRLNGKIQAAQVVNFNLCDHGISAVLFVPKIIGQSLDKGEKLALDRLDSLKQGKFSEDLFVAVKNNLLLEFYERLEDHRSRALAIMDCFIQGTSWEDFMNTPEKIKAISRADVVRLANKYYGNNFLAFHSKMGFPKKDKLKKPGFKPVSPKEGVKSEYAKRFEKIPALKPEARFVDFSKDITRGSFADGTQVYMTKNPINNIFSLNLMYKVSEVQLPMLDAAAAYMNYIGTDKMDPKAFKRAMGKLGVTYRVHMDNDILTVEITGLEDNAKEAIALVNELLNHPKVDAAKYKLFVSDEKLELKQTKGDPTNVMQAGRNYLYYGKYSKYLTGQSPSELAKIKPESLLPIFKEAMSYPMSIHYVGRLEGAQVLAMFAGLNFKYPTDYSKITLYHRRPFNKNDKPKIYIVYRKDARQSHILFFADGAKFNKDSIARQQAFNSYFGEDMSSLVFQEIREFRSLAYSASMIYSQAREANGDNNFAGYIGCQGDKTKDALEAALKLLKDMPEKPDRMESIREGLIDANFSNRPGFRDISTSVEHWMEMGYFMDPSAYNYSFYSRLTFNDITSFYKNKVKNLPVSIFIVGNKASVPIDDLKKLGDIVILKEKDIIKK